MSINLSELDFKLSLEYISDRIGIELPLTNYNIFRKFMSDTLEENLMDCGSYLKTIDSDKIEYNKFVDIVTINETYFFREEKHFVLLKDIIFPALEDKQKAINIWSAACSTGEEAISLFLTAKDVFKDSYSFKVFGSDVNKEVLEHFGRGIYRSNSFREDGFKFHDLVKENYTVMDKAFWIKPELLKEINRLTLNLSNFNKNVFNQLFDLIFLRNTLIYFSFEKRKDIIDSIVNVLEPGGFLFLSATEMPLISHTELELIESNGTFYFQKKNTDDTTDQNIITESILQSIQSEKIEADGKGFEKSEEKINIDKILEYAADKLNNRIFTLVRNPNYDMALDLISIIYRINNNEIQQAIVLINEFEVVTSVSALTLFMKGYTFYIENKKEQAYGCFKKALRMDNDFWPAGFYLSAILMEKRTAETRDSLQKCIAGIKEYIRINSTKYQIFLEGFNGKYFLRICNQWLKKI